MHCAQWGERYMWTQQRCWQHFKSFPILRPLMLAVVCCFMLTSCSFLNQVLVLNKATDIATEIYPDDFDFVEATSKGIGTKRAYTQLQDRYLTLFSGWLTTLFDFSSIDQTLADADVTPVTHQDYYASRSQLGSKYIYLRNNIHPERLSTEQIKALQEETTPENQEQQLAIVKQTYVDVLTVKLDFGDPDATNYITSYENTGGNLFAVPNTALVFFLRYDLPKIEDDDAFWAMERHAGTVVTGVSEQIQQALSTDIDTEVVILDGRYLQYPIRYPTD